MAQPPLGVGQHAQQGQALDGACGLRQDAVKEVARLSVVAQVVDLIGCVQRELRAYEAAQEAHRRATSLMAERLPPDHPLRLRNALYQARLADRHQPTAQTQQALALAGARLRQTLPADSVWQAVIDQSLRREACPTAQAWACVAVL